jgi:hypothetical protein
MNLKIRESNLEIITAGKIPSGKQNFHFLPVP